MLNIFPMDNLSDDQLIEILLRLPTAKAAICSRLVCKRWSSLIGSPYFISRFKSHHINEKKKKYRNDYHYAAEYPDDSPTFFIGEARDGNVFLLTDDGRDDESSPRPKGLALNFLPVPRENVSLKASCNDILLCQAWRDLSDFDGELNYYICNPFTMQWHLLPPIFPARECTVEPLYLASASFIGLVCEPSYQGSSGQQLFQSRIRVLRFFPLTEDQYAVDTYCSETGQWDDPLLLSGSQYHIARCTNPVAHDGKLHWYNGKDVVAYDPFNNGGTILIDGSGLEPQPNGRYGPLCLGVCQGSLRVMQLVLYLSNPDDNHLGVWELKDHESRRLSLVRKIMFKSMISKHRSMAMVLPHHTTRAHPITCHPEKKDVVFLAAFGDIVYFVSCNIQTGDSEYKYGTILPPKTSFCSSSTSARVYPIVLPWWPTPVSMLPKKPQ